MVSSEFIEAVNNSAKKDWLEKRVLNLNLTSFNYQNKIEGIVPIYEFISRQVEGYKKLEKLPSEIQNSQNRFIRAENAIKKYILEKNQDDYTLDNILSEISNQGNNTFLYDLPETNFLIHIFIEYPNYYNGASEFIINNNTNNSNNKNYFIGYLLAHDFLKNKKNIKNKANEIEKKSIQNIREDFENLFKESNRILSEYFESTKAKYDEYAEKIDTLKNVKEKLFNEWFEKVNESHNTFSLTAEAKIKELEKTYEQLLKLQKPAEFWNKRADKLNKEGKYFLRWLIILIAFACITLYGLLWLTPQGMLLSFIKGDISALKWSIVYITFISFLVIGIRALTKAMFSSFHLARDAEEREQLSYFYLALLKDSAVDEKDRNLIMQSLFSRSDTGLLKEDSAPTMPTSNVAERLMGK